MRRRGGSQCGGGGGGGAREDGRPFGSGDDEVFVDLGRRWLGGGDDLHVLAARLVGDREVVAEGGHVAGDDCEHDLDGVPFGVACGAGEIDDGGTGREVERDRFWAGGHADGDVFADAA